jgi:hypothetical protein
MSVHSVSIIYYLFVVKKSIVGFATNVVISAPLSMNIDKQGEKRTRFGWEKREIIDIKKKLM